MRKTNKFSPEVRERAVRMVQEHRGEFWAAGACALATESRSQKSQEKLLQVLAQKAILVKNTVNFIGAPHAKLHLRVARLRSWSRSRAG